ncbi:hypothetical protein BDV25DRAFT_146352 [Aspergillus avenaceus]|uniref:Uncharacterized protein n=1 Tax=Aspergillus avenaceus TaxID=36643 RepID=A0A5N6U9G6_ASPAV|nr:hypothetical protein BDV25DRAFT_146352 [Aspergillus avenaceus]
MGKQNTITNCNFRDSLPSLTLSTLTNCTFRNITSADCIHRSDLHTVNLSNKTHPGSRNAVSESPFSTGIQHGELSHCIIANTDARRCQLSNCELIDVYFADSLTANGSRFENILFMDRSSVQNSIVAGRSTLSFSSVSGSTVRDECSLDRSQVKDVELVRSRLQESQLQDCDVSDCVITKSNFAGMVLRYGIWENGQLVGRIGDNEVVAVTRGGNNMDQTSTREIVTHAEVRTECDSELRHSDDCLDSQDLPPPYRP